MPNEQEVAESNPKDPDLHVNNENPAKARAQKLRRQYCDLNPAIAKRVKREKDQTDPNDETW